MTSKGCVFKWKAEPFGVANAPALFQELMNKILYILRRRPFVQELIFRGAELEAHIDDVSLGPNTNEDHVLLLMTCCHGGPGHGTLRRTRASKQAGKALR